MTVYVNVAVLIPCYNEEIAIGYVLEAFNDVLPDAKIYVYDNNSEDRTTDQAEKYGAIVRKEFLRGKGNVVRRMFADVEADVYVLIDGDGTYDVASAPVMIKLLLDNQLDMVCGRRISNSVAAYRRGHEFGNAILSGLVSIIFGKKFKDMLTGYRVFSRRFVKSFPALSSGFEIETELAIHALELKLPTIEVETPYSERRENSTSKLRTLRDGFRIFKTILILISEEKPLQLFFFLSSVFFVFALILFLPIFIFFLKTGLVPRFPTLMLISALIILSALCISIGLIMRIVTLGRKELKRLLYLHLPAPNSNK